MHNPPHPGELIKEIIGEDGLNLTITNAAEAFGISRKTLSTIINGRVGISPESWLNMQQSYDLWCAEKNRKALNVKKRHKADA